MTPRQVYNELSCILGKIVGPEIRRSRFVMAERVSKVELKVAQGRLLLILEKIDYDRAHNDFARAFSVLRPSAPLQTLPALACEDPFCPDCQIPDSQI